MSITGDPEGDPTKTGVAVVDVLAGKDATIGILAALADRQRTGRGCRVEVNLLSSLLASLVNQAQGFLETGMAPARMGNQHPSIAPYETLRCRDGLIAVSCGNDGQFLRLATVPGSVPARSGPALQHQRGAGRQPGCAQSRPRSTSRSGRRGDVGGRSQCGRSAGGPGRRHR
jgi:crotonobetainyl-CoA:carnitine CoA-transferase CaiB-like acyl-CoA transferase